MNNKTGDFIRELRTEKNMSQTDLGKTLNIDRTVVNKWENSKVKVSADNLELLSELFNVTVDELLAGERKNKKNNEYVDNIKLTVYDEQNKEITRIKKSIKIVSSILVTVILIFLIYYFLFNYNSISLYSISTKDNDVLEITNGMFFKTSDKVYFEINTNYKRDGIEEISLIYDNKEIMTTTNTTSMGFKDCYGYQEYIDFNNLKNINDKFSIRIRFDEEQTQEIKLRLNKDYANSNLFKKSKRNISNSNSSEAQKEHIIDVEKIAKKIPAPDNVKSISYNGNKYYISIYQKSISIKYKKGTKEYELKYISLDNEILERIETTNDKENNSIYLYNISNNFCDEGECQTYKEDIELLKNITYSLNE